MRCSQTLLYEFITSPSGLSEWFADDVNIRDGIYTFIWDGSQQQARLLALKEDAFVRYQWVDKTDGSYFEFRIQIDELTGDVSLMIVDFADSDEEKESSRLLWDAQVDKLMKTIGSHG
ncbi:MAG: SRPBCC domain-containing protein [Bacteroidia bacterium]|nr:SRPBCC domain-containing protein [Bacteroidia bacterium]